MFGWERYFSGLSLVKHVLPSWNYDRYEYGKPSICKWFPRKTHGFPHPSSNRMFLFEWNPYLFRILVASVGILHPYWAKVSFKSPKLVSPFSYVHGYSNCGWFWENTYKIETSFNGWTHGLHLEGGDCFFLPAVANIYIYTVYQLYINYWYMYVSFVHQLYINYTSISTINGCQNLKVYKHVTKINHYFKIYELYINFIYKWYKHHINKLYIYHYINYI